MTLCYWKLHPCSVWFGVNSVFCSIHCDVEREGGRLGLLCRAKRDTMPPKKQQQNAFSHFMYAYRKREEAKGIKFPGGLKDVANACSEEWRLMTPQQKAPYEAKAKQSKLRNGNCEKYTSQGVPLSLIEKEERRKQDLEHEMDEYINNIMALTADQLKSQRFYVIHVNFFCHWYRTDGVGEFVPAEFALAEFSLKHGVENEYSTIINVDIPMGYAREAAEHSEETHQIPRNPPEGETDFHGMYKKLIKLLEPETLKLGGTLPPLYTTKSCMDVVPDLLNKMATASGESLDIFRVYSLEALFLNLRNAAASEVGGMGFPSVSLAEAELQKDYFAYAPNLPCDYHNCLDSAMNHCSLSVVKRWAFTICDHCCADLGIEMVPNRHCPWNTDSRRFMNVNETLHTMHMDSSRPGSVLSMTGVSERHRERVSARTYDDEQRRRAQPSSLQIIDHGQTFAAASAAPVSQDRYASLAATLERPLRPPNSTSFTRIREGAVRLPERDDYDFPSIGRGSRLRNRNQTQQGNFGRGHGSQMD